jgi:DNA polymerase III gamma/tau subunit
MRDAQSKLDQVIAFTGSAVSEEDVTAILGLVGRDLVLDAVQAVADEDASAAFALAARAVEGGSDLRLVCRELARVVRDLLVLSVDPSRSSDPEIAGETERDRLAALTKRFSREDLLRAFDLLTRAETEIRAATQPRYQLEMALLRWIYLRKLVPIEDLIAGPAGRSPVSGSGVPGGSSRSASAASGISRSRSAAASAAPAGPSGSLDPVAGLPVAGLKDALLAEIQRTKSVFYNTVVAQAQKIEVTADRVTFLFAPGQRALRDQFEQQRAWLESLAQGAAGRQVSVMSVLGDPATSPAPAVPVDAATDRKAALKERVLADAGVQALLEVFPGEIRDVEEL